MVRPTSFNTIVATAVAAIVVTMCSPPWSEASGFTVIEKPATPGPVPKPPTVPPIPPIKMHFA